MFPSCSVIFLAARNRFRSVTSFFGDGETVVSRRVAFSVMCKQPHPVPWPSGGRDFSSRPVPSRSTVTSPAENGALVQMIRGISGSHATRG